MLISAGRKIREENKEHMHWFILAEVEEKVCNKVFWDVWMVIRENSHVFTIYEGVKSVATNSRKIS